MPTDALTLAVPPITSAGPTPTITPTTAPLPTGVMVGGTTAIPAQTQTPEPSPSSSGSSVNVGAIAGGAIGGVVFLGAIAVFAWYKIRTHDRGRDSVLPPVEQYNPQSGYGPGPGAGGAAAMGGAGYYEKQESQGYTQNNQRESVMMPQSPTLRYPEPDAGLRDEVPSGNVGKGNY